MSKCDTWRSRIIRYSEQNTGSCPFDSQILLPEPNGNHGVLTPVRPHRKFLPEFSTRYIEMKLSRCSCLRFDSPFHTEYDPNSFTSRASTATAGMDHETIRATPSWNQGEIPGLRYDCVFVFNSRGSAPALRVQHEQLQFLGRSRSPLLFIHDQL